MRENEDFHKRRVKSIIRDRKEILDDVFYEIESELPQEEKPYSILPLILLLCLLFGAILVATQILGRH